MFPRTPLATCTTLPALSIAERKALKMQLETKLHRQMSAVSGSRITALLEQRRKNRKFSVPSSFDEPFQIEPTSVAYKTPASGPNKYREEEEEEEEDDDDDYEEYPYEYVTCGPRAG